MRAFPLPARLLIASTVFLSVTLMIACIGGGWIALARVDPLLAVPGMGLAGCVAAATARGMRVFSFVAACAGMSLFGLAVTTGLLAGWLPWTQLALATMASLGAAFVGGAVVRVTRGLWRRGWAARAGAIVGAAAYLLAWQRLAWLALAILFAPQPVAGGGPRVLLVSSLPLRVVDERGPLTGGWRDAPILGQWPRSARINIADSVQALQGGTVDVLVLAHPAALPPADLVLIDDWVRRGGKTLVLADGLLSWPPPYPLADARNPPVTSLLTPLLSHWGLRLDAPDGLREAAVVLADGPHRVALFSPGRFVATAPGCVLILGGAGAQCGVGRGQALLIADADLLRAQQWQGPSARPGAAGWRASNPAWLADRIALLAGERWETRLAEPVWQR